MYDVNDGDGSYKTDKNDNTSDETDDKDDVIILTVLVMIVIWEYSKSWVLRLEGNDKYVFSDKRCNNW